MKTIFLSLFFLISIPLSANSEEFYDYKVSPQLVINGDSLQLTFSAQNQVDFHKGFPKMDKLRYVGASQGQNIINNFRESYVTLNFVPRASGEITIPAFEVTLDGKIYKCKAKTIKVWPNVTNHPKSEIIKTRLLYNGQEEKPDKLYTGQTFTLDYEISVVGSWRYLDRNTFYDYRPKIKAENLNLQKQSQDLSRYLYFKELDGSRVINGVPYRTKTYRYVMSPVKSGEYDFSLEQQIIAVQKSNRGLPRNNTQKIDFSKTEKILVTPLPAPPQGIHFLDLTGEWQLTATTSKETVQTGHTFELILKLKGQGGDPSRIHAPQLSFPGFEIDPRPEITFNNGAVTIKYAMRALNPKAKITPLTFATFDHVKEKFVNHSVKLSLNITGQDLSVPQTTPSVEPDPNNSLGPQAHSTEYKPALIQGSAKVTRPLLLNLSPIWYLSIPLLPLIFLGVIIFKNRSNPKEEKSVKRSTLAKKLKKVCLKIEQENESNLVNSELIPLLAEYHGLPQGSTANELAQYMDNAEVADLLEQISNENYLPQSVVNSNLKKLTNAIAKTLIILLSFSCLDLKAQSSYELYENNKYQDALNLYLESLKAQTTDASLYANAAHCHFMLKQYPEALAKYETAIRLAPSNQHIRESLNNTLKVMKISRQQNFFFIINRLRPDQWLNVCFIVWSLCWVLMIFMALKKANGKRWVAIWGGLLCALSLLAFISQNNNRYRSQQALLKTDSPLFTQAQKGTSTQTALTGDLVHIEDKQGPFYRISFHGDKLWVHEDNIIIFW